MLGAVPPATAAAFRYVFCVVDRVGGARRLGADVGAGAGAEKGGSQGYSTNRRLSYEDVMPIFSGWKSG